MQSLEDVPSDIIINILISLNDRTVLRNLILACRKLYYTFDSRRFLILEQVYGAEVEHIARCHVQSNPRWKVVNAKQHHAFIKSLEGPFRKQSIAPKDALALHLGAWKSLRRSQPQLWPSFDLGRSVIARSDANACPNLTLRIAEEIWPAIVRGRTLESQFMSREVYEREMAAFVRKLSGYYLKAGRSSRAMQVLRDCYQERFLFHNSEVFSEILHFSKQNDMTNTRIELVSLFKSRVARDRHYHQLASDSPTPRPYNFHGDFCLVNVYLEYGLFDEVSAAFRDAVTFSTEHRLDAIELVGLARRAIKKLKSIHHFEHVLKLRYLVHNNLSRSVGRWTSIYVAWAKDYAFELRLAKRCKEALEIEEQVWHRLNSLVTESFPPTMFPHCYHAAWALRKTYAEKGDFEKYDAICKRYQQMVARGAPQLDRSAGTACREPVKSVSYFKADVHVPIIC